MSELQSVTFMFVKEHDEISVSERANRRMSPAFIWQGAAVDRL